MLIRRRGILLVLSVLLGVVCGIGILSTSFNTSVGELLSENDPYLDEMTDMEQRFPSSLTATFALANSEGEGSIFNQQLLAVLRDLENRYQELSGATRLSSILGYRSPQRNFVLFERPSEQYSQAELEQLHGLALQDPLLAGTFLSEQANLTFATVFFDLDVSEQATRLELADQILALLNSLQNAHSSIDIYANSDVLFERSTQDAMIDDLTTLMPIVILICVLTICYCFHSITFGACILSQALLSIISTVGVIGYTDIGFNTISVIAPLVVVIISVAHSVHIISVYKQQLFKGLDYQEAMDLSIRYNFKPVLLATVTTGIGFMSLNLSSSPAIQDFGRIVALGISFAFVFTFTLLPALLIWVSVKTRAHGKTMDAVLPYRLIRQVIPFWQRHDKQLFVVCTGLAILTLLLLPLNETDFDRLDFIETDSEVGKYYDITSRRLQRGPSLTYGLRAAEEDGAIEPEFLRQVESFSAWLVEQPEIDNAGSLGRGSQDYQHGQLRTEPGLLHNS